MGFAALNPSYIAKDVDGRNKSGHDEMKAPNHARCRSLSIGSKRSAA